MEPDDVTGAPERTFTQDELNRLLADQKRKLLAEQPDLTDLRRKAKAYDEAQAAQQSEVERLTAQLAEANERAAKVAEQSRATLRRAAVLAEASRAGAVDPDVVHALLSSDDTIVVGDDGAVTGVAEAVASLLEAKAYLKAAAPLAPPPEPPQPEPAPAPKGAPTPPKGGADGGPKGRPAAGQLTREDLSRMKPEEIVAAKAEGRLNHLLGA